MFFRRHAFAGIFILFLGLYSGLMLSQRLYPFVDLPNHLAASTILRYADQDTPLNDWYTIRPLFGTNILHLIFCSLDLFPSVEFANRIYYAIYALLLPLGMYLVIRQAGGNPWYSLLAFPLLFNFNVTYGFSGFTLAIALFLLTLFFTLRYLQNRAWMDRLALMALFILIFFAHGMTTQYAIGVYGLLCLVRHWRQPAKLAGDALLVLPLVALNLVWWNFFHVASEPWDLKSFLADYYRNHYFQSLPDRKMLFNLPNIYLFEGRAGSLISWSLSLVLLGLCLASLRRMKALWSRRADLAVNAVLVFLAFAAFCYLALPDHIPDALFLYQRLHIFLFFGMILAGSLLHAGKIGPGRAAVITALVAIHFGLWADLFRDFDRENRGFTPEFFATDDNGRALAGLIAENQFRGWPAYRQFPNFYTIWKQGPATSRNVDYAFGYIRRKVSVDRLPAYSEWSAQDGAYDGRYKNFDYFLLRGDPPDYVRQYLADYQVVKTAEPWTLWGRTEESQAHLPGIIPDNIQISQARDR
jgi:hypothetical protein